MKLRIALATAALGVVALLGVSACGQLGTRPPAPPRPTCRRRRPRWRRSASPTQDLVPAADTTPSPDATGTPAPAASRSSRDEAPPANPPLLRRLTVRRALARNVEHGEMVVKTKDGDKTIDVQRGTVTAITATTVTVKSTDGFTETWTFGNPIHVIEHRTHGPAEQRRRPVTTGRASPVPSRAATYGLAARHPGDAVKYCRSPTAPARDTPPGPRDGGRAAFAADGVAVRRAARRRST